MENEDEISVRYETELAAIAALDRLYYLTPCPTVSERAAYAARKAQLEYTRSRLYAELEARRIFRQVRHCRSVIRQSRVRNR